MLVVHPESCCDICLDSYTIESSEPANSPHAIGCGHIFCLTCLQSLSPPSACPLCRKVFQSDHIKKLHLTNPPKSVTPAQDAINDRPNLLLQRVALVSGEHVPEADVAEVVTEVEEWLEADPHPNMPLQAAVAALHDSRTSRGVEQSLRSMILDIESKHALELSGLQFEMENLQNAHSRYHNSVISRIQDIENEHASEVNIWLRV
ncbi:hypothetical protein DFH29DRAFT_122217 [Suillus ampliporus]|nr:hypothetical protein DFH29DRAFT_122217 [Suillus ampliporus]